MVGHSAQSFDIFVAIDWSGAKNGYHRKLQIALCQPGQESPILVTRRGGWTRQGVLSWLQHEIFAQRALVGFDFSFAPPFVDSGQYFNLVDGDSYPHDSHPKLLSASNVWAYVDSMCCDDDLGAASFIEKQHPGQFYRGSASGAKHGFQRWRVCEQAFNSSGGGKASSIFDCVGASQVAKASFAGMRLLHQATKHATIWPFNVPSLDCRHAVIVEIYCRAFIKLAIGNGGKRRTMASLNTALQGLGSLPSKRIADISDDKTDAMIAAAGLRAIAADQRYWNPAGLTAEIARTEGWTFGVL
jgi:hypothetical protein